MPNVATTNWQAWIKKRPAKPAAVITLHATAEADTDSEDFAFLVKRIPQGTNVKILMLDVKEENGIAAATNPQSIHYAESLRKSNQYSSIEIFWKGEKIKEIKDIIII